MQHEIARSLLAFDNTQRNLQYIDLAADAVARSIFDTIPQRRYDRYLTNMICQSI